MRTPPRRAILLLVNPVSGGKVGSGPPLSDDPERLTPAALGRDLRERGLRVEVHELAEDDDAAALAAEAARAGRDLVIAGGDGTVGLVAGALAGSQSALGIVPLGSFNNIARGLRLPERLDEALEVIAAGRTREIDIGEALRAGSADGRRFMESAGVGLDAVGFGAAELAGRRGIRRGLRQAWRVLRWRRRPMAVDLDGERLVTRALMVTVSNGPYYGFGFAVAADASVDDGRFEVSIFRRMSKIDLVRHFAAVARGRRSFEPRIDARQASEVRIEGLRGALPVHVDGQSVGTTPITFVVRHRALRIFG